MKPTLESNLKLNSRLLPILVGLLFLTQLILPYKGWTILLVGLGGLWLISYWWAKSLLHGLKLSREMRFGWAQVGDHIEERFTVINNGDLPALWIEIIDHSTIPHYRQMSFFGNAPVMKGRRLYLPIWDWPVMSSPAIC